MLFTARPQLDSYGYDRTHENFSLLSDHLLHNECEVIITVVNHHIKFIVEQCAEGILILML